MQVLVLILLGSYLVDKWLLEICFDVLGERVTAAQELTIELLCGLGEPLEHAASQTPSLSYATHCTCI